MSVMPDDPLYLRVRNWHRFQHYTGRKPIWIKLYLDLDDPSTGFRELSYADQGLLQAIWRLAAKCNNFIPDDIVYLRRALDAREAHVARACATYVQLGWLQRGTRKQLEKIARAEKKAGNVDFRASNVLEGRKQISSLEVEKEKEKRREQRLEKWVKTSGHVYADDDLVAELREKGATDLAVKRLLAIAQEVRAA